MGADMEENVQPSEESARKVLIALNSTPESKAGLVWAVTNLVRDGDEVLLYHMVKTPTLIPTAMGMVPYAGATPALQRAHILVASSEGTKLLRGCQAYCKSKMVLASAEVGRCDHREEDLLQKVREEDATHLVLGTGGAPRFTFRLAKSTSLTARICQQAPCPVILVDKKKRPTFYPANQSNPPVPEDSKLPKDWEPGLWQWHPVEEPGAKMLVHPGSDSPRGSFSSDHRARLTVEIPSEIVLGEMATPPYAFQGDAKDKDHFSPRYATDSPKSPEPTKAPNSYTDDSPQSSDAGAMKRSWSQNLELFSVPESDTEGYADSDSDLDLSVSADSNSSPDAFVSADVIADACSKPRNILPELQAAGKPASSGALPTGNRCDLPIKRPSGNTARDQLLGSNTGSVKDGVSTSPAPRAVLAPPSSKQRPVPSVNALISRVYQALNQSNSSPEPKPPAKFCDSPADVGARSPRREGIPQKPTEQTDGVAIAGIPVSQTRTLVKPGTTLNPLFAHVSNGSRTAAGRPPAVPRPLDRRPSDGPSSTEGRSPETSVQPYPFGRSERTPGGVTGGRRTPGRTRPQNEAQNAEGHEAAIRLLREQVARLTESDELRDDVAERAAARWERARRLSEEMAARTSPARREQ